MGWVFIFSKKNLKHLKLAYFSSYLNKMKETIKSNAIKPKIK